MAEEDVSADAEVVTPPPPAPPRVWLDGEDVSGEGLFYGDY
jgi:hypothetical protein